MHWHVLQVLLQLKVDVQTDVNNAYYIVLLVVVLGWGHVKLNLPIDLLSDSLCYLLY